MSLGFTCCGRGSRDPLPALRRSPDPGGIAREFAWSSQQKAARVFNYSRGAALQDGKEFATQKPVALMAWCLSFVPKARTILDPFMGSGTTGVAALQLGREFVGIEIRPEAFRVACERISNAQRQQSFLDGHDTVTRDCKQLGML